MGRWGFSNSIAFAVAMTLRDISYEKQRRLIKTQKFYQECYDRIADDGLQAFNVVTKVVQKASRRYIPNEIGTGTTYLPLYCFALVIERQGRVTAEQNKIMKIFFDKMSYPFSQNAFINAARTGSEISDFRKVVSISKSYAGGFWVNFFRALYKSGTQKDLQDVVDCTTSMIMRFSVLGNPESNIGSGICTSLVDSVNYQINQVRDISLKEIDWLGIIPIPDRLEEMKKFYESLIDNTDITDDIPREDLLPLLELLILNCISDIVMMTKQPKSVKLQMLNEAVTLSGIHTAVTPEEYITQIANQTEEGNYYKQMFAAGPPLGMIWQIIMVMGDKAHKMDEAIGITNDILSILLQIENYLDEKYHFLGADSIAKSYIMHILEQLLKD